DRPAPTTAAPTPATARAAADADPVPAAAPTPTVRDDDPQLTGLELYATMCRAWQEYIDAFADPDAAGFFGEMTEQDRLAMAPEIVEFLRSDPEFWESYSGTDQALIARAAEAAARGEC
ncbi:hypothetical protein, partial [Prescottella equi]|uniref:hypothetical protein n=1 Tax=Rhodococcus hoagii TaxID=43767 RepID=UPI000A43889B